MSRPFDVEAAKRGEPFGRRDIKGAWYILTYVAGPDVCGYYVLLAQDGGYILSHGSRLSMAPSRVIRWANVYPTHDGDYYLGSGLYDTKEAAETRRFDDYIATMKVEFEV